MSKDQKVNGQYVLATFGAVLFTWELHEFFHWLAGELLGNPMAMTLNTCYPLSGNYLASWHEHVVSAAGPLITLVQAGVVFLMLKRNKTLLLFPLLLTCLYSRAMAGVMNIINPNDEGRLSLALGVDVFFLSVIVTGILFFLVYKTVKANGISTRLIVVTVLWIMLFSSILILSDQFFHIRLL
jgi:hypothetical protein